MGCCFGLLLCRLDVYKRQDHDGYITPGAATNGDHGDLTVIGNSTPRYEYSFRLGLDYKGFDFSIFCQGIGKRKIWGSGQLAIPGYSAKEGAMPKTFATEYWTPERTDAFYPRAWDLGGSNSGFGMQVQSKYLLNIDVYKRQRYDRLHKQRIRLFRQSVESIRPCFLLLF